MGHLGRTCYRRSLRDIVMPFSLSSYDFVDNNVRALVCYSPCYVDLLGIAHCRRFLLLLAWRGRLFASSEYQPPQARMTYMRDIERWTMTRLCLPHAPTLYRHHSITAVSPHLHSHPATSYTFPTSQLLRVTRALSARLPHLWRARARGVSISKQCAHYKRVQPFQNAATRQLHAPTLRTS